MIAIFAAGALLVASAAEACECIRIGGVSPALSNGEPIPTREDLTAPGTRVVLGKVTSVRAIPTGDPEADKFFINGSVSSVSVERSWNGPVAAEFTVFSGFPGPGCGYRFVAGERYMIFVTKNSKGEWETSTCTRTTPVKAVPDLEAAVEHAVGRGQRGRRPKEVAAPPN